MASSKFKTQVEQAIHLLENHQGQQHWGSAQDPIALLVETILSHNTNDKNRDAAFKALKAAYPDWQALVKADAAQLAEVIRTAGLKNQKAQRIQFVLKTLKQEQGEFTLNHLKAMPLQDALSALVRFPGVGKKTAGIVLTYGLQRPYFAVDTHINRIGQRIGWVSAKQDAHDVLNELVPDEHKAQFHMQLIKLGRTTCKARKPLCEACVLSPLCDFYQGL